MSEPTKTVRVTVSREKKIPRKKFRDKRAEVIAKKNTRKATDRNTRRVLPE